MTRHTPPVAPASVARPSGSLPGRQLLQVSLYWLGLTAIFAGLGIILQNRLEFEGLGPPGREGETLGLLNLGGVLIAILVQPTIGSISDYTTSRWGRRKPYIVIGSTLDLVFLVGIAFSQTFLAVAAFIMLLQFSSNFAQGPFQGYIPDLVPARQVGLASALVGIFSVLGNVAGVLIATFGAMLGSYVVPTIVLGIVELITMLSVAFGVHEGRAAKPREGRSWGAIAREAWGTDILGERSFVWLVGSRLFVLMGGATLVNLAIFFLSRSLGLDERAANDWIRVMLVVVVVGTLVATIPAARISDRVGRKPLIFAACAIGMAGSLVAAAAPGPELLLVGVGLFGIAGGTFLAVDWALITDLVPKASSGRYMGISNVATASAGVLATLLGGIVMDAAGAGIQHLPAGPRAAYAVGAVFFALGALLLVPVREPMFARATRAAHRTRTRSVRPTASPAGAPRGSRTEQEPLAAVPHAAAPHVPEPEVVVASD